LALPLEQFFLALDWNGNKVRRDPELAGPISCRTPDGAKYWLAHRDAGYITRVV